MNPETSVDLKASEDPEASVNLKASVDPEALASPESSADAGVRRSRISRQSFHSRDLSSV